MLCENCETYYTQYKGAGDKVKPKPPILINAKINDIICTIIIPQFQHH